MTLSVAVDPDRAETELARRHDIVEVALRDMNVPVALRTGLLEELQPVAVARLVRADLRRDDRELERDADPRHRGVDELAVGVREAGELPASRAEGFE